MYVFKKMYLKKCIYLNSENTYRMTILFYLKMQDRAVLAWILAKVFSKI